MQCLYFGAKRILWPKRLKNFSLFSTFIKLCITYKRCEMCVISAQVMQIGIFMSYYSKETAVTGM